MNNVDKTGPIKWNTRTYYRSGKLEFRNPADTFSLIHNVAAILANRNVNWPLLTADDEPLFKAFAATLSNKTLDATCNVSAAVGGASALDAQYLTLALHGSLTGERLFTAGDGLMATDGGAGGNYTLAMDTMDMTRKKVMFSEEFLGKPPNWNPFDTDVTGTGAAVTSLAVSETGVFGTWQLDCGTTTTGRASIYAGNLSAFSLGQGLATLEMKVKLPTLSTVSEEYIFRIGFMDATSGNGTDAVIFEYDRLGSGGSGSWRVRTRSNTVTSSATTSTTIVGGTWYKLTIVVNAAGTNVDFYIGGTLQNSITTNIPVGAGRELSVVAQFTKNGAGTTSRTAVLDYCDMEIDLTTPR